MNYDRIIQIASYQVEQEAEDLVNTLSEHGIPAMIRNRYTARLLGGFMDVGGFIVEVSERSCPQIEVLVARGTITLPDNRHEPSRWLSDWVDSLPLPEAWTTEDRLSLLLLVIVIILLIISLSALALTYTF